MTGQHLTAPVAEPWARSADEVLHALGVGRDRGLTAADVRERRRRFGMNRLRQIAVRGAWPIFFDQFKSLLVVLLALAAALSFAFGELNEALAILVVIALNSAIGFVTELRAARSMDALRRLGQTTARVRRDGHAGEIRAGEIVPGDIIVIEAGDVISADIRLVEASRLQADESALTGESAPVGKRVETVAVGTELTERSSMLFKGTAVTRGSAEGVVVGTGMATELGHISSLVEQAKDERTPLEKRLDGLGHRLICLTLIVGAAVAAAGMAAGKGVLLMVQTGVALAVATIPEGLPVVATLALARGMWRMARRNALVRRLSAVETLGATSVICTDKTGTLTENRMTVVRIVLAAAQIDVGMGEQGRSAFSADGRPVEPSEIPALEALLRTGVLCNNASLSSAAGGGLGDPLEVALLAAGAKAGLDRQQLAKRFPEVREEAFDSELKMMSTIHEDDHRYVVAVKGAPESVVEMCSRLWTDGGEQGLTDLERRRWLTRSEVLAKDGLRVLALATRHVDSADVQPYRELTLLGLVGLLDPPRREVASAIAACREAGIRVVMVTGDQPATALAVARALDLVDHDAAVEATRGSELADPERLSGDERRRLLETTVFARVTPEQKLRLIGLYQEVGAVVAMTGDGVNDAPALKKADIGIAMGRQGTQVAREAADMVLKDDAFGTIVAAVAEGRTIFHNIRAFVLYLLSCNLSEILIVGLASLVNAPLPILPLQILFLNLVTDVFPALALGLGEGDPAAMKQPPRDPKEPVLMRGHWLAVAGYGAVITLAVLGAFALAFVWLGMPERQAVSVSFLTLAFAQLGHVFNMRGPGSGLVWNEVTRNPFVWGALGLCSGLLVAVVHVPGLADVLSLQRPGADGWALVLGLGALPAIVGPILRRGAASMART